MAEQASALAEQVALAMLREDRATVALGMQVQSVDAVMRGERRAICL